MIAFNFTLWIKIVEIEYISVNLSQENDHQHQPSNSYNQGVIEILQKENRSTVSKHLDLINALGFRKSHWFSRFMIVKNFIHKDFPDMS